MMQRHCRRAYVGGDLYSTGRAERQTLLHPRWGSGPLSRCDTHQDRNNSSILKFLLTFANGFTIFQCSPTPTRFSSSCMTNSRDFHNYITFQILVPCRFLNLRYSLRPLHWGEKKKWKTVDPHKLLKWEKYLNKQRHTRMSAKIIGKGNWCFTESWEPAVTERPDIAGLGPRMEFKVRPGDQGKLQEMQPLQASVASGLIRE